jgi:hypothetical protein
MLGDKLPRWQGRAFTADGGIRMHIKAPIGKESLRKELAEATKIYVENPEELVSMLVSIQTKRLQFVTRKKNQASQFGFPLCLELPHNTKLLAEFPDGKVLVLKPNTAVRLVRLARRVDRLVRYGGLSIKELE